MNYPNEFPIHVLIATATSGDRETERAFFFVRGRYVGTDTADTSAGIEAIWRNGDTIALNYTIYRSHDFTCCPTGGAQTVRFHWTGTRLVALDPIPTADVRHG